MSHFAGADAASTSTGADANRPGAVPGAMANTVLGPVPVTELGVAAVHESLLSVVPGAEHAPDISIDRAEIFDTLAAKLADFKEHGGGTIVDSTGMFHGRDLPLYEALSRATGVHIIASTGMGPEEMLGGYFLTPQTNPPTPWPADRFANLFSKEVAEGMVVPRVERRGAAGLVTTAAARAGITPTEESLFRGAAKTSLATGAPVSIRFGTDALRELDLVLAENLPADRVLVGGLDRSDAVEAGAAMEVVCRGAYVGIDHVGSPGGDMVDDETRAALVMDLVQAGHANRIILSTNAIGVAKGQPDYEVPYSHVLATFMPRLRAMGLSEEDDRRILAGNPQALLTVH